MYIPWEWIRKKTNCDNYSVGSFVEQLNYYGLECEQDFAKGILFINFVTAHNRKDLKSWWGLAREVSVLLNLEKTTTKVGKKHSRLANSAGNLQFTVKSKQLTEYSITTLHSLFKNRELPIWISESLIKNKLPVTNQITAIANFVGLETGWSFHLFDLEKLQDIALTGQVLIREAGVGEVFTNNLQEEESLPPGSLLIETNGKIIKPLAASGENSSAVGQTIRELLVINIPLPGPVGRFPANLEDATRRFEETTGEFYTYHESKTSYYSLPQKKEGALCRELEISSDFLEQSLGVSLPQQKVETILDRLGFSFSSGDGYWIVKIPSFRSDIIIREDLLEEIGRLLDYNSLPGRLPAFENQFIDLQFNSFYRLRRKLALYLLGSGYQEVLSYSLTKSPRSSGGSEVLIVNPRSSAHVIYRSSFIDSHLEVIRHNQGQGRENLFLFETGDIYSRKGTGSLRQEQVLTVTATGKIINLQVHQFTEQTDLYWMKGLLENLFLLMDIDEFIIGKGGFTSSMDLSYPLVVNGEEVGFIRQCSPRTLAQAKVKNVPCFILQFSFSKLLPLLNKQEDRKYTPVSYLPVVTRNISFLIERNIPLEQIVKVIKQEGGELLLDFSLVDIYSGEKGTSSHSLNFQLLFQGRKRNLRSREVEAKIKTIWKTLSREFSVLRR